MEISVKQIREMRILLERAVKAQDKLTLSVQKLQECVEESIGMQGFVDYTGDGFGFTPESDDLNHIPIENIIEMAENGEEITEEVILDSLSV